jgi:hypothetical protein
MHPAAEAFVREFGGLTVHMRGPGHTRARSGFDIYPEWDDWFGGYAWVDGPLFPVGAAEDSGAYIALSESGRVYVLRDRDDMLLVGRTPDEAIINFIEGFRIYRISGNAPEPYRAGELVSAIGYRLDTPGPSRRGADWFTVKYDDGSVQEVPAVVCDVVRYEGHWM